MSTYFTFVLYCLTLHVNEHESQGLLAKAFSFNLTVSLKAGGDYAVNDNPVKQIKDVLMFELINTKSKHSISHTKREENWNQISICAPGSCRNNRELKQRRF